MVWHPKISHGRLIAEEEGLALEFKSLLTSHDGQFFAKAFFVGLPLDFLFAVPIRALVHVVFFTDLVGHGRPGDEADVLSRGWESFKYYWIAVAVALFSTAGFAAL